MHHVPFRLLRTTLLGSTILGLAAGAHLVAGGSLPALPIMAVILALHLLCTTIATAFRLTLPTMIALLASSQFVLHQGFELLSHGNHAGAMAGTAGASAAGHAGHHALSAEAYAASMMADATAPGIVDLSSAHAAQLSPLMLAAHIAATLAAAGLLAYGENALWSLTQWLRPLFRSAAVVPVVPVQRTRPGLRPRPLPRLPWRNLRPDTRRGPPAAAALFA